MTLTYSVKSQKVGDGQYRPAAESKCCDCGAVLRISMTNMMNNPEAVAKLAHRQGWEFDAFRAGRNFCPACIVAQVQRRRGEAPNKEISNVVQLAKPATEARPVTNEERAAIRRILDAHFDDSKGIFLDGYSDQRIGAEVDVPWASVRALREAAYGPLRGDPEIDALRTEAASIVERAEALKKQAASIADDATTLLKKVTDTAKKMGLA